MSVGRKWIKERKTNEKMGRYVWGTYNKAADAAFLLDSDELGCRLSEIGERPTSIDPPSSAIEFIPGFLLPSFFVAFDAFHNQKKADISQNEEEDLSQ